MFQLTPYVALYGLTSVIIGLVLLYVLQRRNAPGGLYFSLIMASGLIYSTFNTLEMAAVDTGLKILFAKLTYIGVVSIAPTWFLFNLVYMRRNLRLKSRYAPLIWVVPGIVLALVFTNEWHHLIWTSITPSSPVPGSVLIYQHGPAIWLLMVYSYTLMLAGTLMLVKTSMSTYKRFRQQTIVLLLGALIALSGNVIYFVNIYYLKISLIEGFDLTPFTTCLVGIMFAWSMFRYRLFDLVPVARETVVASISDAVAVVDDRGRVIDLNPAARKLFGYQGPLGVPATAALAGWPELLASLPGLGEKPSEVKLEKPEGARWFATDLSPLRDNRGSQTGSILVMRDVTSRKQGEKALEESRRNLRALFDSLDDLIFVIDEDGNILEVNDTTVRKLGFTRGELLQGKSMGGQREVQEQSRQGIAEVLAGRLKTGPSKLVTRGGETISVETHLAPGLWGGRPAVFGIARDVTELQRRQEKLGQSNRALQEEVEERMIAESLLESSLQEKQALLAEIHHRINDNMQIISGLVDMQRAAAGDREVADAFREIRRRIVTMALVHQSLYEEGELARISFDRYATALVDYLHEAYPESSGVKVACEMDNLLLDLDAAVPCGQIISELLSNSLKYAYPGSGIGEVRVSLHQADSRVKLVVGDDGPGMPPGFDLQEAHSLGLQLVAILADQIDGQIELLPGPGTKFELTFLARDRALERIAAVDARGRRSKP